MHGLRDIRVIDFATGIAGAYCTKLMADAGADVIKVEQEGGDPLRRYSATSSVPSGEDGALFRFLNASKRSVVGDPDDDEVRELVVSADLVVESFETPRIDASAWRARDPGLVILSITPWGRTGPYAGRPWTEFTVQAECGSLSVRGLPQHPPLRAGGRITEWLGGTFSAVAALAAVYGARRTGHGEYIDFSLLEAMNIASSQYRDAQRRLAGDTDLEQPARHCETPSIEPTADGYIGVNTNSNEQFQSFLVLIERPDLMEDKSLYRWPERLARWDWWHETVHSYTRTQTTADLIERASALRIPVAPVNDGKRVLEHPHLIERGVFIEDPSGGFKRPVAPYLVDGERVPPPRAAPRLGEHGGRIEARTPRRPIPSAERRLPLDGVRVLDLTAWWAGPVSTQMLATLGADVIHVEAIQRLDGMRMTGGAFIERPSWWELSVYFLAANANKRGITLNLGDERGLEALRKLIARSDVIVENYSPRVMDAFGMTSERVRELNPRAVYIRMPAFGLDGPWRDNVGFAQTMEQMTGMAWVTGLPEDQPRIPGGPCDPLAGMHSSFAALVGLTNGEATGHGPHFECAMIEGALNAAAEQVIEYTAYGNILEREGNRAPEAAPQGLYPCQGVERWLAISVNADAQWESLKNVLGRPDWAEAPELAHRRGRRAQQDLLDEQLGAWAATRDADAAAEQLIAAGVPAACMVDARLSGDHPQLVARGFAETVGHAVAGDLAIPTVPFRYASVAHWTRSPAPLLGEHNEEVLAELGYSLEEIESLREAEVIGRDPKGL